MAFGKTFSNDGSVLGGNIDTNISPTLNRRNEITGLEYQKNSVVVEGGLATTHQTGEFSKTIITAPQGYEPLFRIVGVVDSVGYSGTTKRVVCGSPPIFTTWAFGGDMLRATMKASPKSCANQKGMAFYSLNSEKWNPTSIDGKHFVAASGAFVFYKEMLFKLQHSVYNTFSDYFDTPIAIVNGFLLVNQFQNQGGFTHQVLYAIPMSYFEQKAKAKGYKSNIGDVTAYANTGAGATALLAYLNARVEPLTVDDFDTGYDSTDRDTLQDILADWDDPGTLYTKYNFYPGFIDTYSISDSASVAKTASVQSEKIWSGTEALVVSSGVLPILVNADVGLQTVEATKTHEQAPPMLQDATVYDYTPGAYSESRTRHYNASYELVLQYGWGRAYAADSYTYIEDITELKELVYEPGGSNHGSYKRTFTSTGELARTCEIPLVCDEPNEIQAWLTVVYARIGVADEEHLFKHSIISATLHVRAGPDASLIDAEKVIYTRAGTFNPIYTWSTVVAACTDPTDITNGYCAESGYGVRHPYGGLAQNNFNTVDSTQYNQYSAAYPTPLLQRIDPITAQAFGNYYFVKDRVVINIHTDTRGLQESPLGNWQTASLDAQQAISALVAFEVQRDTNGNIISIVEIPLSDDLEMTAATAAKYLALA